MATTERSRLMKPRALGRPSAILCLAYLSWSCHPREQSVACNVSCVEIRVSPPTQIAGEFSSVLGLVELSDRGRVLISDAAEGALHLVDLQSDAIEPVGRQGGGPEEYRVPGALFRSGNMIVVHDTGNRRFLVIDRSWRTVSVLNVTDSLWGATLHGVDPRGDFLLESAWPPGDRGADSATVIRWESGRGPAELLFKVKAPDHVTASATSGQTLFSFSTPHPFSFTDEWAVLGDGRMVVARAQPFHIELRSADGELLVCGRAIPYLPVRVGARDRQELARRGIDEPIPDFKPPMIDGSALASPDGYVWIQLHAPAEADSVSYVIVEGSGGVEGVARFPAEFNLVGLGHGAAYLSTEERSGLHRIWRATVVYP